MGLDITAFPSIKKLTRETNTSLFIYRNPAFDVHDGLEDGHYQYKNTFGFKAGSYSGYSEWRQHLAKMMGHVAADYWKHNMIHGEDQRAGQLDNTPFGKLINFSDCEGVIGPVTSAALSADFENYRARAESYAESLGDEKTSKWFLARYNDWAKAFSMAANKGMVMFH